MTGGVGWTLVCGPQREWARLDLIYPRGAVTRAQLALYLPQALAASLLPAFCCRHRLRVQQSRARIRRS